MKKLILIGLMALFTTACAVTRHQSAIVGTFTCQTPYYRPSSPASKMLINLEPDGRFNINWHDTDNLGVWKILDKNQILLKYDKLADTYTNFSLTPRNLYSNKDILFFIDKNTVKLETWILKREK